MPKDHVAPKVKYDPGISYDTIYSMGLTQAQVQGDIPLVPESLGGDIPWTAPPSKLVTDMCVSQTKAGLPCRARPIVGNSVCIGHSRVKK